MQLTAHLRRILTPVFRRAYLPSFVAVLVVSSFALYADYQNNKIALQEQRNLASSETSRLRAQIEGEVSARIQLVRGIVAAFSDDLDMSQERYSALMSRITGGTMEFINIAAAPDLIINRVYPLESNRPALGLNYHENEARWRVAYQVRDTGKMAIAGPLNLVQGGVGLIARLPVWDERDGERHFWGLMAAVIDAEHLYESAGLRDPELTLDIALIGKDGKGADGELFFGNPDVLNDAPILMDIQLPNGTWQIATRPKNGWIKYAEDMVGVRLFFLGALLLVLTPTIAAARLSEQRRAMIVKLQKRDEELERLSLVAKHASDSVLLSDPTGKIIWVNDGFTRMTGYAFDDAIGRHAGQLLNAKETDPYTIETIKRHQKRGERFHTEILNRTKSGKLIWVDTNIFPVLDEDGKVVMSIGIEREITETKRYEAELAEAKRAAETADRAKSEFLANMSHEIRTPMNAIIGMSELLSESPLSSEDKQNVTTIRESGHALLKIINDILDLSRLESGKLDVCEVDFDLHRCIDSVADLLRHKAEQKGLFLTVEYKEGVPQKLRADDGRLRQILMNLIGNAVKFTSEGGVRVVVSRQPGAEFGISIDVIDTGIGISPEQARHVFDRFSQADAAITRSFGGTGLGLTISTMLARRMGGDISLCEKYNQGACFSATIMGKAPIGETETEVEHLKFAPEHLYGTRILLAEDNKTNRLLIRKYLADYPLELIEVENGVEAVEYCKLDSPDLVLMDMSMPELDGLQATRIIRDLPIKQPPIIALTANAFASDKQACLEAGMDMFLSKPINKTHLLHTLSAHLEQRLAS
ncbi:response regulator [Shimia sp. R9_3]|uniref:response regulator n=1 Tax=Shimia sp. R9_3 TaxID=2821113 RepID=UPI001ADA5766|nr:response regulator [Shimia sp. R9_3]MBO9402835.1 response regulator [Shimia sp. R9_3]